MNDTKNTNKELHEAFDNFHAQTAEAIAACEAFIAMDINAPRVEVDRPREAIFVRLVAEKAEPKKNDDFRDMMPTSEELYYKH
jgi:hypothetical protein